MTSNRKQITKFHQNLSTSAKVTLSLARSTTGNVLTCDIISGWLTPPGYSCFFNRMPAGTSICNMPDKTYTPRHKTIAIDDPVAWASVSPSVTGATVLINSPDGATSIRPLRHCCSHLIRNAATRRKIYLLTEKFSLTKQCAD